jgi:hypothetical protein
MLFNPVPLKGIAPRVKRLAKREGEVSLITQQSLGVSKNLTPRPDTPSDRLAAMRALESALPHSAVYRSGSTASYDGLVIVADGPSP